MFINCAFDIVTLLLLLQGEVSGHVARMEMRNTSKVMPDVKEKDQ